MNGRHNNYEKPLRGRGPKYLIRDRDKRYATRFSAVVMGSGIKEVKTPYRTPQANGICERFIGSLRRECIDHVLIHGDKHLGRIVREYTAYFNEERPHQGIDQRTPDYCKVACPDAMRLILQESRPSLA